MEVEPREMEILDEGLNDTQELAACCTTGTLARNT